MKQALQLSHLKFIKSLAIFLILLPGNGWLTTAAQAQQAIQVDCTNGAGKVSSLISAINIANLTPQEDTIELAENCIYTLTQAHSGSDNGLPTIRADLVIEGNGATIERSPRTLASFRLLAVENSAHLTLRNLTLQGGLFSGGNGGAVQAGPGTNLTLINIAFTNNRARVGGAIFTDGSATIHNSEFANNIALQDGGGLFSTDEIRITGGHFAANQALKGDGGGLYVVKTPTLTETEITLNIAAGSGGGLFAENNITLVGTEITNNRANNGGGLAVTGALTLSQADVISNTAQAVGGGVSAAAAVVENSRFESNKALTGGGLAVDELTLKHTSLISNSSDVGGGVFSQRVVLEGNTFIRNRARFGAGLFLIIGRNISEVINNLWFDNSASGDDFSATLYMTNNGPQDQNSGAHITHNTITGSSLIDRPAIVVVNLSSIPRITLRNNIIVHHAAGVVAFEVGAAVTTDHNLYFANTTHEVGDIISSNRLEGDPLFVAPTNGDFHLQPDSPARDTGLDAGVTADFDGGLRPVGKGFDIGAFEFGSVSGPDLSNQIYLPLVLK